MADASAGGGGKAIATAVATNEFPSFIFPSLLSATSNAVTVNGAMAQALSTVVAANFSSGSVTSTAKTSFEGVNVESTAQDNEGASTLTTDAIAQGGSGQTAVDPSATAAVIATALPDEAYAATLIGSATNVADVLLGPGDEIFGTAILEGPGGSATFDFSFRGDLILGDVDDDRVTNLGFFSGPIHLTLDDPGVFVLGGAVPEPSMWVMMLIGFAGLGFTGYRSTGGRCSSRTFST
jgi:hypothetical protein